MKSKKIKKNCKRWKNIKMDFIRKPGYLPIVHILFIHSMVDTSERMRIVWFVFHWKRLFEQIEKGKKYSEQKIMASENENGTNGNRNIEKLHSHGYIHGSHSLFFFVQHS